MSSFLINETNIEKVPTKIHHEGAIRNALKSINDHKTGIPEFLKNAAGAYHRLSDRRFIGKSHTGRAVVLLFRSRRGRRTGAIGCLDLVGMTEQDIELFQNWFDPTASTRGDASGELWGGHGNGAKSYMCKMFDRSWFATVRDGYFTRMGWVDDTNFQIGYMPSKSKAKNVYVETPKKIVNELLLNCFGIELTSFPGEIQRIITGRPSWTCFVGLGAKNWVNPAKLLDQIQNNPQAIRAIEYCSIYAFIDGKIALNGKPLTLHQIPPMPGGEESYEVVVPSHLDDPDGGDVDTTLGNKYPSGKLVLHTSKEPMMYTLRHRHFIQCESETKGLIGLFPVEDLAGRAADHIYGTLFLESLQEFETNFRTKPNDAPLTRAIEDWLRKQIGDYAKRFQEQEEVRHTDKEMNELRQFNEDMNLFLQNFLDETEADEGGNGGGTQTRGGTGRSALPEGQVVRIEHNLGDGMNICGQNVSLNVRLSFYDMDGKRVRPVPVHWESTENKVAVAQLGSIVTGCSGECQVRAVADNGVRSSQVYLKVIDIQSIEISPDIGTLPVGARKHLEYKVTSDNTQYSDAKLDWHSDNEEMVKVGSNTGVITITAGPGCANIWATSKGVESNHVQINTSGEGSGGSGTHYPKVLLSEIDDDPDTQSKKRIPPEAGTVVQDVADRRRNIYWVNMRSPMAEPFLKQQGELNHHSPEFMMYFAERYAEVIFRNELSRGDQWEPGDIVDLMRDRPTRLRQALAKNLQEYLQGDWHPK